MASKAPNLYIRFAEDYGKAERSLKPPIPYGFPIFHTLLKESVGGSISIWQNTGFPAHADEAEANLICWKIVI